MEHLKRQIAERILSLPDKEQDHAIGAIRECIDGNPEEISNAAWSTDYDERPPTIVEFLDSDQYLGRMGLGLYDCWRKDLEHVFAPDSKIYEWVCHGALGIGKTTALVIAILYKVATVACLKDPQKHFVLSAHTPIVFGFFNIWKYLARDIGYSIFESAMRDSPFFNRISHKKTRSGDIVELHKDIKFAVGAQAAHAIGHGLFGGLIDEASFGKDKSITRRDKSQMQDLYISTRNRIISRFASTSNNPGFLAVASSSKDQTDFLTKHLSKIKDDPGIYISRYALWEAKKHLQTGKWFYVFAGDEKSDPKILKSSEVSKFEFTRRVVKVPDIESLRKAFTYDLPGAVRELAGVSTFGSFKLITNRSLFNAGMSKSTPRDHPFRSVAPAIGLMHTPRLVEYLNASKLLKVVDKISNTRIPLYHPNSKRIFTGDLSKTGDCTGLAMGCISKFERLKRTNLDGEEYVSTIIHIWVDFALRVSAIPGSSIDYEQIRELIFFLRDNKFQIVKATFDSYQSEDTIQTLKKSGIDSKVVSVDRTRVAYDILKSAIYEGRFDMYNYDPFIEEITDLDDHNDYVDHPADNKKDVSDAVAQLVFGLMTEKLSEMTAGSASPNEVFKVEIDSKTKVDFDSDLLGISGIVPSKTSGLAKFFTDDED